jgi:hypothetical protein
MHSVSTPEALHARRVISPLDVHTPLLVPSFSTRGFPDVDAILSAVRHDLQGSCLVSAHDIAKGLITVSPADLTDIVIVDSGGYEAATMGPSEGRHDPMPPTSRWERAEMRATVAKLAPGAGLVVVSFDHYGPIEEQARLARDDFAAQTGVARDFLAKPTMAGESVNMDLLEANAGLLAEFDVIGITERELGGSFSKRCENLRRLRRRLSALGARTPIHVFGSITPVAVAAYFFSGADVFDGLNWLRFEYVSGAVRCVSEPRLFDFAARDEERLLSNWRGNLRYLKHLQSALARVSLEGPGHPALQRLLGDDGLATARALGAGE